MSTVAISGTLCCLVRGSNSAFLSCYRKRNDDKDKLEISGSPVGEAFPKETALEFIGVPVLSEIVKDVAPNCVDSLGVDPRVLYALIANDWTKYNEIDNQNFSLGMKCKSKLQLMLGLHLHI
ncbi:hypothetical protein C1646_762583 [Rhizophagus diaphanus]|nr:hypothetical protein C1646_762583 [Rhizophagus diaphanus] [Rhizophagus sp. MUCL 43196]